MFLECGPSSASFFGLFRGQAPGSFFSGANTEAWITITRIGFLLKGVPFKGFLLKGSIRATKRATIRV